MMQMRLAPRQGRRKCSNEKVELMRFLTNLNRHIQVILQLCNYWAEMVNSGLHLSMDESPNTSMFQRAGGGITPSRKKDLSTPVTQALADAATTVASALSPRVPPTPSSTGTSPARVIEQRSKLYKQLGELRNLHGSGILTEEEYVTEKECILGLLHQLRAK